MRKTSHSLLKCSSRNYPALIKSTLPPGAKIQMSIFTVVKTKNKEKRACNLPTERLPCRRVAIALTQVCSLRIESAAACTKREGKSTTAKPPRSPGTGGAPWWPAHKRYRACQRPALLIPRGVRVKEPQVLGNSVTAEQVRLVRET